MPYREDLMTKEELKTLGIEIEMLLEDLKTVNGSIMISPRIAYYFVMHLQREPNVLKQMHLRLTKVENWIKLKDPLF